MRIETLLLILGAGWASAPGLANEPQRDFGLIKTGASPHARMRSVDLGAVRWAGGAGATGLSGAARSPWIPLE